MTTIKKTINRESEQFSADIGDYREVKIEGRKDKISGVRIATGTAWDMDHLITRGLISDGFVFLRKRSLTAEVNVDQYDKTDFILSLGKRQARPKSMPGLDQDRALLEWICKQGGLVFVVHGKSEVVGTVVNVGDRSCTLRSINDEVEVDQLIELPFSEIKIVIVGTHMLRLFDKYIVETCQA